MEIFENPKEWLRSFQEGWLSHFEKTGEFDWKKYIRPRNLFAPGGSGIDLSKSRLLLISSAGAYLKEEQKPFDASNPLGDYSIRLIPSDTPLDQLAFAHEHYDGKFVAEDPQVLLPLQHLRDMVSDGLIGELAPVVVSFSGYHPNVIRVVKELIPAILSVAKQHRVEGTLLVPASSLGIQSVALTARALELNSIATTFTSWNMGIARLTAPPRATISKFNRGSALGQPGAAGQQRRVLEATLSLLQHDAPLELVTLEQEID
jgi:D-proline reductase (dithiol) PrdB